MKNQQFATLKGYERIKNSVNGNPKYILLLDGGDGLIFTLRSSNDCSWCYSINHTWVGKTIAYTTTRNGRINYCKLATVEDTFTDEILMGENKIKDTNITRALKILKDIRDRHPEMNKTEVAQFIAGGHNSELYNIIVLLLNEVK